MTDFEKVYENRRKNLTELIARLGGRGAIATIARRIGHGWPGFVSQMKSQPHATGHRRMTEETAREIERAFSLPIGSMDRYPLPAIGEGAEVAAPEPKAEAKPAALTVDANGALMALLAAAQRAGVPLPPDKLAPALKLMADDATDEAADAVVALLK